jgi:hypothetical protein
VLARELADLAVQLLELVGRQERAAERERVLLDLLRGGEGDRLLRAEQGLRRAPRSTAAARPRR